MSGWLERFRKLDRAKRLSIIFGILIVVGLITLTLGILAAIPVKPYRTYTNYQEGFSIKFPDSWKVLPQPEGGAVIAFIAPKQNDMDIIFENVNVSIKILPKEMTADRLSDVIVRQVTGTFGKLLNFSERRMMTIGGRQGYRITFSGEDQKIEHPFQYVVVWTNVENKVYIITFFGLEKDYHLYQEQVEEIFRSFKFVSVKTP